MKICVLGGGTVGSMTLLTIFRYIPFIDLRQYPQAHKDVDVTCIYDSNIPHLQVGESASSIVNKTLSTVFNTPVTELIKEFDATIKTGTRYFWTKANGNVFDVQVLLDDKTPAKSLHIDSSEFSKFVINKLKTCKSNFTTIDDTITDVTQDSKSVKLKGNKGLYEFDFLIDCRGTPSKEDLANKDIYTPPKFEYVNSVILYPEYKTYNESYTSVHVHENGWMFGVPLRKRKGWGFLYNNNFLTTEEAIKQFSTIKNIDASTLKRMTWKPYYRNKALDNKILYLGSKLYFFDPHGALPLHFYNSIVSFVLRGVLLNVQDYDEFVKSSNTWYLKNLQSIQDLISINYCGPNDIKSDFWDYAKSSSTKFLKESTHFNNAIKMHKKGLLAGYWAYPKEYFYSIINGYKIDLSNF